MDNALRSIKLSTGHTLTVWDNQTARQSLSNPDKSAFESLDHSECGEDHDGDDWNHYVSIRYTVRG